MVVVAFNSNWCNRWWLWPLILTGAALGTSDGEELGILLQHPMVTLRLIRESDRRLGGRPSATGYKSTSYDGPAN